MVFIFCFVQSNSSFCSVHNIYIPFFLRYIWIKAIHCYINSSSLVNGYFHHLYYFWKGFSFLTCYIRKPIILVQNIICHYMWNIIFASCGNINAISNLKIIFKFCHLCGIDMVTSCGNIHAILNFKIIF